MKTLDAIWRTISRLFRLALFGGCVFGFLTLFAPKLQQYNEINRRLRNMQDGNRDLEAAVRRLEMNQQRFVSDRAFVERTARNLGMAKPGEIIYKYFSDEPADWP